MLSPLLADISPGLLVAAGAAVVVAVGLLIAGAVSARRAANLPAIPKALKEEDDEDTRSKSLGAAKPPPKPAATPAPIVNLNLSPEERARAREAEEARKKEAYRLKKQQETEAREQRANEEAAAAAQKAEDARRLREAEQQAAAEAKAETEKKVQAEAGRTLADGLAKTRGGFMSRLNGLFGGPKKVEGQLLGELEEVLFSADIGVKTASQLLEVARQNLGRGELADGQAVRGAIRVEIERIIAKANAAPVASAAKPRVWMIVGVNGVGKTTTIGKLAAQFHSEGKKVVLGAADTFRAAATEQLDIWAGRAHAELVRGAEGGDPGAVAFEAVRRGRETGANEVLVDTAGRLHTKAPLMEELKKVKRVLAKAEPGAPHEILLVLDSTNGQNAIAQARQFHEALQVTAIALTKLDGTAKGGVVIGICEELGLPLRYIGVGEAVGDLQAFEPHAFVEALFA